MNHAMIERVRGHTAGYVDEESYPDDVMNLAKPDHSKREVVGAGKILRENILVTDEAIDRIAEEQELLKAFRIAHNWRDAHMLPLLRVRQELSGKLRSIERGAVSAARLKRMASIRKKLQRPITLYQMQDIAGCRAILRSMREVDRMASIYRDGNSRHTIQSEDNYIATPKRDGYRSHHIILKFHGEGEQEIYNRQTVEIQLRTRLQHAWSTAVEAVGLVRGEDIKGGKGDADWRRFFELMSSYFAHEEGCTPVPTVTGDYSEISKEIRDLSKRIKAVSTLESYNKAIRYADGNSSGEYARYYLLQFNPAANEVTVEPFRTYAMGSDRYIEEEGHSKKNTVLVEVNKVSDLLKAFPNYFLDVTTFTEMLRKILMPGYKTSQQYDLSWLSRFR